MCSCLGQMLDIPLESIDYLLLMLKFALLLPAHITLMLELDFQHMCSNAEHNNSSVLDPPY